MKSRLSTSTDSEAGAARGEAEAWAVKAMMRSWRGAVRRMLRVLVEDVVLRDGLEVELFDIFYSTCREGLLPFISVLRAWLFSLVRERGPRAAVQSNTRYCPRGIRAPTVRARQVPTKPSVVDVRSSLAQRAVPWSLDHASARLHCGHKVVPAWRGRKDMPRWGQERIGAHGWGPKRQSRPRLGAEKLFSAPARHACLNRMQNWSHDISLDTPRMKWLHSVDFYRAGSWFWWGAVTIPDLRILRFSVVVLSCLASS